MNGADIIGQGWRFPIRVNAKGGLDWSSGPDRIQDAIWIILSTSLGERLMRPEFGAGIQDDDWQVIPTAWIEAVSEKISKSPFPSAPPPQPVWRRPRLPGRSPLKHSFSRPASAVTPWARHRIHTTS